ncbi:MAG: LysM domain-containing protein [Candidatus Solibacter sp.]
MPDPTEALQSLLGPMALTASLFPPTSRYAGIQTAVYQPAGAPPIKYLLRRFIPPPESFAQISEHTVHDGDRLDNLAAFYLGDPEAFWRLADANRAMRPAELTERPGTRLRIALPQGIPGPEAL